MRQIYGEEETCANQIPKPESMGVPKDLAWKAANSRRGYWFTTHTVAINMAMTK